MCGYVLHARVCVCVCDVRVMMCVHVVVVRGCVHVYVVQTCFVYVQPGSSHMELQRDHRVITLWHIQRGQLCHVLLM